MSLDLEFVEIDTWPQADTSERRNAPFKATWFKTQELLTKELHNISATEVQLWTMHGLGQRRNDGTPRTDRQPSHPGVILTFKRQSWNDTTKATEVVEMRFPCDTFTLWEDNVRAVALALEALRKVDRYGVNPGSQYTGFRALPPAPNGHTQMTPEQAARFIIDNCGANIPAQPKEIIENSDYTDLLYKLAAKRLHPDKGGDAMEFQKLEEARRMLREVQ